MSGFPTSIHRYEIEGRIGEGGMGALYLARDPALDRQVAIKVLREGFDNPDLRERFVREAKSAARLTHVNIVRIFDFGEHEGRPYIAMEYIPGETLADKIRRRAQLSLAERLRYMEDLCSGLAHAHKAQIVHRDVKPANVMISPEGELKILDFGIARVGDSRMTQAGMLVGTLNYMSPEQLAGGQVDHRSDIFAVGALFYELLAYRQAFPGGLHDGLLHRILHAAPEPLEKFCPDLDPEIVRIVLQSVEKDAARRYQSLSDMEREIARVRDWLPAEATQIIAAPDAATAAIPVPRPSDAGRAKSTPPVPKSSPGSAPGERPAATPGPAPKTAAPSDRTVPMPVAKRPPVKPAATDPALLEQKRASEVRGLLDSAQKALDAGQYAEAIGAAEAVLLRTPDQPAALALAARARRERQAATARSAAQAALSALASGHLDIAERHIADGAAADTDHPDVLAAHVKVKQARAAAESERARRAAEAAERERARAIEAEQQRQAEEAKKREAAARHQKDLEARRQADAEEQRRRDAEAEQQRQAAAALRDQQAGEQLRIAEDALARAQADMALAALDRALEIDPGARVGALRVRAEALRDEQARTEEGRRQREREERSAAARERIRTIVHSTPVRIAAGALVLVIAGALILPRLGDDAPVDAPASAPAPAAESAPRTTPAAPVGPPPAPEPPSAIARARTLYADGQRVSALEALRSADPSLEGKAERNLAELWLTDARLAVAGSAERALRGGARATAAPYRAAAAKRAEGDQARDQQQLPEALLAYWQAIGMYDALQGDRPASQPQPQPATPSNEPAKPPVQPPAPAPSTPVSAPPGSSGSPAVPPPAQPRPADPPPPAPDPQAERESILRTVYAFAAAMNNRDVAGVQRFRRLSSEEQKLIEDLARNLRAYSYQLTPTGAPTIEGTRATLRCVRQQTFVDGSRRKRDQNDAVLVALEKAADGWIIAAVTPAR